MPILVETVKFSTKVLNQLIKLRPFKRRFQINSKFLLLDGLT